MRRELKLEPFVVLENAPADEEAVKRAVVSISHIVTEKYLTTSSIANLTHSSLWYQVNEECPQCHHPQLEYYTKQVF